MDFVLMHRVRDIIAVVGIVRDDTVCAFPHTGIDENRETMHTKVVVLWKKLRDIHKTRDFSRHREPLRENASLNSSSLFLVFVPFIIAIR